MTLTPHLHATLARLDLERQPVAVGFFGSPPAGLPRVARPQPAGCGYWKQASEGEAFYTLPEDHENCPVGAFTHGVTLSPAKAEELQALAGTMIELKYLSSAEVSALPHRTTPLEVAAYAPLGQAPFEPDLVIFRGNARQIMLVSEAARSAGVFAPGAALGRPACAMVPHSIGEGSGVASLGCIGNRVYTGLDDSELYFAVPGTSVRAVLDQLAAILDANRALETFHTERMTARS